MGQTTLSVKQWVCFKFLCHSCSLENQCDLRLPQPTELSHGTRLHTIERGFVLGPDLSNVLVHRQRDNQGGKCCEAAEGTCTHGATWVYQAARQRTQCVYFLSEEQYPPPVLHPQAGLCSGLRSSLWFCHKGHAASSDRDAELFPVE